MEDYGEIQFIERNATVEGRTQGNHPSVRTTNRTFYAQPTPHGQRYMQQQQPFYASAPGLGVGIGGSGMFGRMSTGQVIDMVAQIFAALMPLPAAPAVTSISDTDSGNTIVYQTALAQYAKRDEQIRTLGNLVTKLLG